MEKEFCRICCLTVPWFLTDKATEHSKKRASLRRQQKGKDEEKNIQLGLPLEHWMCS